MNDTNRNHHGWLPDRPDPRDASYKDLRSSLKMRLTPVASSSDLRGRFMPPVYDQGSLGSCGPNAACANAAFLESKEGNGLMQFSRLALYYDVRRSYGKENEDTGVFIRDLFKSVNRTGLCLEKDWPYDLTRWKQYPSLAALHEGYHRRKIEYYRLDGLRQILDCLGQGYPVIFGSVLFESMQSLDYDCIEPMPSENEGVLGGHARMFVGHDDHRRLLLTRNSWGSGWGMQGYSWLHYDYVSAWASDFWTLRSIPA